jgi:hypothetical protein
MKRSPPASHRGNWAIVRMAALATCFGAFPLASVFAWLYPEHRDVTALAIQMLQPEQRSSLEKLWAEARLGHEARLCAQLADTRQGLNPACLDYVAWPALAGDHSCSAGEMLTEILDSSWVLNVAKVGARLNAKLGTATKHYQRVNAMRRSDTDLLRADPQYATRAQSNDAHFLLARPNLATQPEDYLRLVLGPSAELNAVATYSWYHVQALANAARIANGHLDAAERAHASLAVLADEAFALHFLEDSFASGHVAGNWGNSAVRKGTHDYYSEHGVEVMTWTGDHFVILGDAYMRPEDAKRTASAIRDSLAQLVSALDGQLQVGFTSNNTGPIVPEAFNVCQEVSFPRAVAKDQDIQTLLPVISQTPIPALGDVPGQLPRFRSEFGPFVGVSAAVLVNALDGGFGSHQDGASATGGLEAAVRVGLGLEGVLDQSGDGLAFVGVGYRQDGPAQGAATITGRGALNIRFRAPFWLIPGDIVVAAPVLALLSPKTLQKMAVQAGNGGLIPWQSGIATRIGRFQFILGREVSLSFYKLQTDHPIPLLTPGVPPINETLVAVKSTQVDLPFLEYRPFRTFSRNQSSDIVFQAYIGFDEPTGSAVVSPVGNPKPRLHTIVLTGLRLAFDWRHYVK